MLYLKYIFDVISLFLNTMFWLPLAILRRPSYLEEAKEYQLSFISYVLLYGSLQRHLIFVEDAQTATEIFAIEPIRNNETAACFVKWLIRIHYGELVNT